MVAYGVLEIQPPKQRLFLDDEAQRKEREEAFERDQLRKLVNDELRRYGLLIAREVVSTGQSWRTRLSTHILYGQVLGKGSFTAREVLCVGDFRECCIKAAEVLDKLDASQVPDTELGQ